MADIEVYTFEDADGVEQGWTTQDSAEARKHAQKHGYRVLANVYEWQEAVPVEGWDYTGIPAPPAAAVAQGHDLEWDPPAAITAAKRWTCVAPGCGATALRYGTNEYGSAVAQPCAEVTP